MAVDANYGHDLQTIRANLDDEVPLVEQNIEKTRRSAFLFWLIGLASSRTPTSSP